MSDGMMPEDGLSVEPVAEITVSATENLDPCQLFSDALDESLLQLDQLLPRMKRQAEDLYRCRRQMELQGAAAGGDHTEATSLHTAIVEAMAWSRQLTSQLKGLMNERSGDTP
jgi:hypothetical protein